MAWMSGVATSGAMAGAGSDIVSPSARAAMACSTVSIVASGEPTNPASASVMSAVPRFARSAEVTARIRARPFNSTLPSTGVPSAIVTPHAIRPVLFAIPFGSSQPVPEVRGFPLKRRDSIEPLTDQRLGHAACEGKAHAVEHHFLAITVVLRRDRRRSHGLGNDIEQPCRADEGWKRSKIVGVLVQRGARAALERRSVVEGK